MEYCKYITVLHLSSYVYRHIRYRTIQMQILTTITSTNHSYWTSKKNNFATWRNKPVILLLFGEILFNTLNSTNISKNSPQFIFLTNNAHNIVSLPRYILTWAMNWIIFTNIFRGVSRGTTLRDPFGKSADTMLMRRLQELRNKCKKSKNCSKNNFLQLPISWDSNQKNVGLTTAYHRRQYLPFKR